ncbi:uncharacterized protein LOC129716729 [Wyeomyia smithii]|uniref:uncharacterized protein LOC129716729 n=1 Tax=Wyeomyia smithii TaxID=174621 RepID=UPI002467E92A|nr:uncharacterized protein LOC129716729 [Wyeomyia smithii]
MENSGDTLAAGGSGKHIEQEIVQEQPTYAIIQSELERAVIQRNHAASRVTQIIETVAIFENEIALLETRRDMLKDCYKTYNQAKSTLEQWMPEEAENRTEVEVKYLTDLATFDKLIQNKRPAATSTFSRDSVRLPTVDLPTLSGTGENWLELIDKFNSLIHRRNSLPTIQKFEYLKLSLKGAALGLIDSLPTTETNYSIAYDLLVDRYNNPKLLIQQHTRELFELKAVAFEAAVLLRELFDSARKHLRCLKILEQPVVAWDAILVHLMANKLNSATRREWESAASGAKTPTYEQLEKFVNDRCQVLDAMPSKERQGLEPPAVKRQKTEIRAFTANHRFERIIRCMTATDSMQNRSSKNSSWLSGLLYVSTA